MIKRFCDKCDKEIKNRDYRILSVTDPNSNIIFANRDPVMDTIDSAELCLECVREILRNL